MGIDPRRGPFTTGKYLMGLDILPGFYLMSGGGVAYLWRSDGVLSVFNAGVVNDIEGVLIIGGVLYYAGQPISYSSGPFILDNRSHLKFRTGHASWTEPGVGSIASYGQ